MEMGAIWDLHITQRRKKWGEDGPKGQAAMHPSMTFVSCFCQPITILQDKLLCRKLKR
jgi:hypothetical protein